MYVIDGKYALGTLIVVTVLWIYIGLINPAVKPGAAYDFNFLQFLKRSFLRLFGYVGIFSVEIDSQLDSNCGYNV